MNNNYLTTLDTLKIYFDKYVDDLRIDNISLEYIISDVSIIDQITDKLIELICRIGVDDNLQPTYDGIVLDGCLETLNSIRQTYYK